MFVAIWLAALPALAQQPAAPVAARSNRQVSI